MFRANGEAGVDLHSLGINIETMASGDSATPERIGRLDFGVGASANSVYYRRGLLFVANGSGGMEIVEVDRDVESKADNTADATALDQDVVDAL